MFANIVWPKNLANVRPFYELLTQNSDGNCYSAICWQTSPPGPKLANVLPKQKTLFFIHVYIYIHIHIFIHIFTHIFILAHIYIIFISTYNVNTFINVGTGILIRYKRSSIGRPFISHQEKQIICWTIYQR